MTPKSDERLSHVHPLLAQKVRALADTLQSQHGIHIEIVQGMRTFAEQDALFAQGRTAPGKRVTNARGGQSNHNYGLACDVCPFVDGQPQWNDTAAFATIGLEGQKVGLEWGGAWKHLIDEPHLQIPGLTINQCFTLYKQGGLKAVWDQVTRMYPQG